MIYDIRMPSLRDKHREQAEELGKKTKKRKRRKSSNKEARAERVTKGRQEVKKSNKK